jgi:hypothetical protein
MQRCSDAAAPGRHWRAKSDPFDVVAKGWCRSIDAGAFEGGNHRGYSPVMVYVARKPVRSARELWCETVSLSVQAGPHPSSAQGTARSEPAGQARQRWAGGEWDR